MEASVESGRQVNQSIKREEGPVTAEVREVVPAAWPLLNYRLSWAKKCERVCRRGSG